MPILASAHLAFLTLIALYLGVFHPGGGVAVGVILAAAVAAELLPAFLRPFFVAELLLIASALVSWMWLIPRGDPQAVHAGVGMALAFWLLVPSRLGLLRWVLSLVIVELLVLGSRPGTGHAALVVIPIGLAALAVDSWLAATVPARSSARQRRHLAPSLLRWALLPALTVAAVTLTGGSWLVERAGELGFAQHANQPRNGNRRGPVVVGLEESLHIGTATNVDRDPRIAARLSWETGADPAGTIYLRAMALSELVLEGHTLSWRAARTDRLDPAPPPTHAPTRWARVLRMPSRSDVVLRPDGGDSVDLDGLLTDGDANLYRPQLGDALRSYRADFDDGQLEADPAGLARYRVFPPELAGLPWKDIEDPHWRQVSPERAATLVREMLGRHCTYALENLPPAWPETGGVLKAFLFSRPEERKGHCQYFATSAVLLLRRAGHIARCVVGFASNEIEDRTAVFRGLHAHAWVEVVNSQGRWQRVDPTPAVRDVMVGLGVDYGAEDQRPDQREPEPVELAPIAESAPAQALARRWWWVAALALAAGALLVALLRRRSGPPLDPRLAELQRRNDDLLRLAGALGVAVGPATPLTEVAMALQQRTGVDLRQHLDHHLAARFGNGPMPEPWPIEALRAAARGRAGTPAKG